MMYRVMLHWRLPHNKAAEIGYDATIAGNGPNRQKDLVTSPVAQRRNSTSAFRGTKSLLAVMFQIHMGHKRVWYKTGWCSDFVWL